MGDHQSQIGFFGKLPSHGDFVRRGLTPDWVSRWDPWLQSGLASSRGSLGDAWLERYLSCPIWRFCLSSGVCGDTPWIGAMMPSVDRVGRYFPLTVATPLPHGQSLFGAATRTGPWFGEVERAMLQALEADNLAAESFAEQLSGVPPLSTGAQPQLSDAPKIPGASGCIAVSITDAAELGEVTGTLMDAMARHCWGTFSLWWSSGSPFVAPSARLYADLPPTDQFWTLLCNDPRAA